MDYRIDIKKDSNGTYLATFPDLPGVHTFGSTEQDALERAHDALATGVEFMVRAGQPIPAPLGAGGIRFHVAPHVASKIRDHSERR